MWKNHNLNWVSCLQRRVHFATPLLCTAEPLELPAPSSFGVPLRPPARRFSRAPCACASSSCPHSGEGPTAAEAVSGPRAGSRLACEGGWAGRGEEGREGGREGVRRKEGRAQGRRGGGTCCGRGCAVPLPTLQFAGRARHGGGGGGGSG